MGPTILIVDDDEGLRASIAGYLSREGFAVSCVEDGQAMDQALDADRPDLVILDVMLPGEDGLSICRRLAAQHGPPVILLSAVSEEIDRVLGLEFGADDYLAKPCSPRELLARIRAVLRRSRAGGSSIPPAWRYQFGGCVLEAPRRTLNGPTGATSILSPAEMALLLALVTRPRRLVSRDELIELTRSDGAEVLDRAIDVQMSRLRRKLQAGGAPDMIRTIRGAGYMLEVHVTRN
ncbi:response regulator transcription factor [Phenylobacterium sp.]|uniref:response regulator n=1 Tax=Phenylobacterium sp. TaxID=1871053 RepID=UPI0012067F63|nr:response regulator transcription factor [Phenylobacterium sp.]THD60319.1 MAG: response regulator transcription factor [Phenylobacterium sp.]